MKIHFLVNCSAIYTVHRWILRNEYTSCTDALSEPLQLSLIISNKNNIYITHYLSLISHLITESRWNFNFTSGSGLHWTLNLLGRVLLDLLCITSNRFLIKFTVNSIYRSMLNFQVFFFFCQFRRIRVCWT